ncbi:hypothetical protein HMPREF1051_1435 [Neisseria sicca VK64]|uniref:Uncharacterized protein n=1 Tax=Neisseria sicca VK64 TaxID=1095748 RepID=I2NNG6_NEISI|nr:hypothetical protein HMPREF1051_1435 [Neisseria sicca VK64]
MNIKYNIGNSVQTAPCLFMKKTSSEHALQYILQHILP